MELVLVFAIALIIFGPKKLPEIGKAIGSAIRDFKRHSNSVTQDLDVNETQDTSKRDASSSESRNASGAEARSASGTESRDT